MLARQKITFVGTSCVGKTTLLKTIETKYINNQDILVLHEVAREFFNNNPMPESERFLSETQKKIRDAIYQKEKLAVNTNAKIVFCDNAPITVAAFTAAGGDIWEANKVLKEIAGHMTSYSQIYLLNPTDVDFVNDVVRQESAEFRDQVHEYLASFLNQLGLSYQLLSGTNLERVRFVEEAHLT